MRRFSIYHAMAVIALVAVNCAAIRAVLPSNGAWDGFGIVVVGLLPLLDAQIIGLYVFASRYRITLRRRRPRKRVGVTPAFAATNAVALAAMLTVCVTAPDGVLAYLELALSPVDLLFRSMGFEKALYDSPFFRSFAIPLFVGAAVSGPPLLLAVMAGLVASRYTFVIAARRGSGMPRVETAALPGVVRGCRESKPPPIRVRAIPLPTRPEEGTHHAAASRFAD